MTATTATRRRPKTSAVPTPRAGTIRRAVWDAVHAVYCGSECHATCREWAPNRRAMDAAIDAVRKFDRSGPAQRDHHLETRLLDLGARLEKRGRTLDAGVCAKAYAELRRLNLALAEARTGNSTECQTCHGSGQVSSCGDPGCCLRPCNSCGGSGREGDAS